MGEVPPRAETVGSDDLESHDRGEKMHALLR